MHSCQSWLNSVMNYITYQISTSFHSPTPLTIVLPYNRAPLSILGGYDNRADKVEKKVGLLKITKWENGRIWQWGGCEEKMWDYYKLLNEKISFIKQLLSCTRMWKVDADYEMSFIKTWSRCGREWCPDEKTQNEF